MMKRLIDLVSIRLYFELYAVIYNFQKYHHLFCFCCDTPDCPDKYGRRYSCFICQFYWNNDFEQLEDVKHYPLKLISFHEVIKTDLFEIAKYSHNKCVFELWENNVTFTDKYTRKVVYLEDFIDTIFLQHENFLFINSKLYLGKI